MNAIVLTGNPKFFVNVQFKKCLKRNNIVFFPISLAIHQAKWEYEKRCLMRSWTNCSEDGKELEAKEDIVRIEAGEEK